MSQAMGRLPPQVRREADGGYAVRTASFAYSGSGAAASCAASWKLRQKLQVSVTRGPVEALARASRRLREQGEHKKTRYARPRRLHLASKFSQYGQKNKK